MRIIKTMERKNNNKGSIAGDLLKIGLGALAGAAIYYMGKTVKDKVEAKQGEEVKKDED